MDVIDHARARALIATSIDADLEPDEQTSLDAHLAACADCRSAAETRWADAPVLGPVPDSPMRDPLGDPDRVASSASHVEPKRRASLPASARLPVLATGGLAVLVIVIAIVSGTLDWQSAPASPGLIADGSPAPTADVAPASPAPTGSPSVATGDRLAELVAEGTGNVVSVQAGFRLTALGDVRPETLATQLTVEPAVELAVQPGADATSVRLLPKAPLEPGIVYRFTLRSPAGALLDRWAFQTQAPVRVVSTVPGDRASGVPLDTGIEVTFDQDGVEDAAGHVSIAPATKGRFEQRGRTLVFLPARPLQARTLYTVTVARGIRVRGTDETMASTVRFRFETAASGRDRPSGTLQFGDAMTDWPTGSAPELSVWWFADEAKPPSRTSIDVYRLADRDAAISAFERLRSATVWTRFSTSELVSTRGLPRVLSAKVRLRGTAGTLTFQLPKRLPSGWYVVQQPSRTRPIQTLLQVTDLAGYVAVSRTTTLVWLNDLASGRPVGGASVQRAGATIGRTGNDGLMVVDTPPELRTDGQGATRGVLSVVDRTGRSVFLPVDSEDWAAAEGSGDDWSFDCCAPAGSEQYWRVLATDRDVYRPTDAVDAWGTIRDRDSGAVPAIVTLTLTISGSPDRTQPIVSRDLAPDPTGTFSGSLPFASLPFGDYEVVLRVGSEVVTSTSVSIAPIRKPAYRVDLRTGHRVYVAGDRVRVTARTTFFDGTPVPGVRLRIGDEPARFLTTGADGSATYRFTAASTEHPFGVAELSASPARAEEGDIDGVSRGIMIFPSTRLVTVDATLRGGRVNVHGAVDALDRDRLEHDLASGAEIWSVDPNGAPLAGARVAVHAVRRTYYQVQVGTTYDEIEKKVVPEYDYRVRVHDLGTVRVTTRADGTYDASFPAIASRDDYQVDVRTADSDGLLARSSTDARRDGEGDDGELDGLGLTIPVDSPSFDTGDPVDLTMREPTGRPRRPDDRYLFLTAQRGLRTQIIQPTPRYRFAFPDWGPPNVEVSAIHFTGYRYEDGGTFDAVFRTAERDLRVDITPDAPVYRPGGTVNLAIRTRDTAGRPVSATVVVRSVDAKLHATGLAHHEDALGQLYEPVSGGILATYLSHATAHEPVPPGGDGSDTTGGGGEETRSDFRDVLSLTVVRTGQDGRATTAIRLSDDLTDWVISAAAFADGLRSGRANADVPVGLPFFADATIAPVYLRSDRPSIVVRAYGSALATGAPVTMSVRSDELDWTSGDVRGTAFRDVRIALPPLRTGTIKLTITARSGSGAAAKVDRLTRAVEVLDSRLERPVTAYLETEARTSVEGGAGLTTVLISDAGAGRYLPILQSIAGQDSSRMERVLARSLASDLLHDRFGVGPQTDPNLGSGIEHFLTEDGGLALVPYSAPDLEGSVIAALAAPDRFVDGRMAGYLDAIAQRPKETRERRLYALAGLAALGRPVLPEIRQAAAQDALTVRERLIVGLGAAALGDNQTATRIARLFTTTRVEQIGDQARFRAGADLEDVTGATALLAMLTAATGDPLAPRLSNYVEANPSERRPYELHAVAVIGSIIDRLPTAGARFAYSIDGRRTVIDLRPGTVFALDLTAPQLRSLVVEPTGGRLGIASAWRAPFDPASATTDPDLAIRRTITPASGRIRTGDLVRVDVSVSFGARAPLGYYEVTDMAPSGLLPTGRFDSGSATVVGPFEQVGQRVSFCAEPTKKARTVRLRYFARVVTPGSYRWEPTVVGSRTNTNSIARTASATVTIR
jgi:hypothetical protein